MTENGLNLTPLDPGDFVRAAERKAVWDKELNRYVMNEETKAALDAFVERSPVKAPIKKAPKIDGDMVKAFVGLVSLALIIMIGFSFSAVAVIVGLILAAALGTAIIMAGPTSDDDKKKRAASLEKRAALARRSLSPQIVCPHCQDRGNVRCKAIKSKKGISGGKATAAVLTGGFSMLATGLSRKEVSTEAYCSNCQSIWQF